MTMTRQSTMALGLIAILAAILSNFARAEAPSYYVTVKMGDTLESIAARYGVSTNVVIAANKLPNVNFMYVGQRLIIPGGALPSTKVQTSTVKGGYIVPTNNLTLSSEDGGQRLWEPIPANAPNTVSVARADTLPQKFFYNDPNGAPASLGAVISNPPTSDKWIDINVTTQTATAYQGATPLKGVVVSTGVARTPTVLGTYKIYRKLASQTMWGGSQELGDYYYLPNVPNVMYFYQGYGFHGTYWHSNFGLPMSHGCVNMTLADAKWFYEWASVGALVVSHK